MRPDRLQDLLLRAARQIPGVETARSFADAGLSDPPFGVVTSVAGSGSAWWHVVVVSAPGDRYSEPEAAPVRGPGPGPRAVTALDTGRLVRTADLEQALAAAVLGADEHGEIAAVDTLSTRPSPPAYRYGLAIETHSGAKAFVACMATRRAGETSVGRNLFHPDETL